jgi:CBS domain-containing protein
MRASDLMGTNVHTLTADTPVIEAARLMVSADVGAMPVVDTDRKLIGIVSEADLIGRVDGGDRRKSWFLKLIADDVKEAGAFIRKHGRTVQDVMTRTVVSVAEDASVGEIARLMEERHLKSVPVTKWGKLVGMVTRGHLLQALLARETPDRPVERSDQQLRTAVSKALDRHHWGSASPKSVLVEAGVVHLWGYAYDSATRDACRVAAEEVPGVKRVENHIALMPPSVHMGV